MISDYRRKAYNEWGHEVLVAALIDRDEEINKLKDRTLDDYVRELIRRAIELDK